MFGVPALCEIGGRGLVPRQHSAISTDAPDEVGTFVVADAPSVVAVISQFLSAGHARGHVCGHIGNWKLRRLGRHAFFNATGWRQAGRWDLRTQQVGEVSHLGPRRRADKWPGVPGMLGVFGVPVLCEIGVRHGLVPRRAPKAAFGRFNR